MIGLAPQELSNLFQTLQGDKDLNSPRKLSTEVEKELALVERKFQNTHLDLDAKNGLHLSYLTFYSFPYRNSYAEGRLYLRMEIFFLHINRVRNLKPTLRKYLN